MQLPTSKRTAFIGVLLAFSLILGYVESLIPLPFAIPGIKIGLSNLPVILSLYLFGPFPAFFLSILKAVIISILFGNMNSMIYSLAGAFLSVLMMILFSRFKFIHIPTVSVIGGVFHNLGQLLMAVFILKTHSLWFYFPVLALSGLVMGALLGGVSALIISPIKKIIIKGVSK